jgi:hypothetical protein
MPELSHVDREHVGISQRRERRLHVYSHATDWKKLVTVLILQEALFESAFL